MSSSLVSVLIAAYNAEPWLSEAIESALGQTHPNVEIVVVDDGSTDGTLGVACQFEGERVRVIHQKNQGACAARNRAFQESSGDYVQFLDADDILHPEKLERQLRCLAEEPEGTVAIGPWVRFRGAVADADLTWSGPDWRDYEPATDWLLQAWGQGGGMPTVVWLTPRTLAEAAGPWNKGILRNQDGILYARCRGGPEDGILRGRLGYYRVSHANSISSRRSDASLRSNYQVAELNEAVLLSRVWIQRSPGVRAGRFGRG